MKRKILLFLLLFVPFLVYGTFINTTETNALSLPDGGSGTETITSISTATDLDSSTATDSMIPTYKAIITNVEGLTGGYGDIFGPASNSDNALARFDGVDSKTIQISDILIDDNENVKNILSLRLNETTDVDTEANTVGVYAKDKSGTSALYFRADDGTITEVGSGGGGSSIAIGQYHLAANQTTNLTGGNEVEFDTEDYVTAGAEFTFNSTNHQWTLTSGNLYFINAGIRTVGTSGNWCKWDIYNTSTTSQLNVDSIVYPMSSSSHSSAPPNGCAFSPSGNDIIEVRIMTSNLLTEISYLHTSLQIIEIQID